MKQQRTNRLFLIILSVFLPIAATSSMASDEDSSWQQHHGNMQHPQPNHPGHTMMPSMMGGSHGSMHGSMRMETHPSKHGNQNKYRDYRPRNAALNFLRMEKMLNLTSEQKTELRKLRDDWIKNQTVSQAQLEVARADLVHMIYGDTDAKTIDEHLSKIGQLEGGLWRAFVSHYKSIIKLLNDKQKKMVLNDQYFE